MGEVERVEGIAGRVGRSVDRRFERLDVSVVVRERTIVLEGFATSRVLRRRLDEALRREGIEADLTAVASPSERGGRRTVRANVSVLHLRREPCHTAPLLTQCVLGEELERLVAAGDWVLVRAPDRYLGWTPRAGLADSSPYARRVWESFPLLVTTAREAVVYATPDERGAAPLRDTVFDGRLLLRSHRQGWVQVELPDGCVGWLRRGVARPASELPLRPPVREIIRSGRGLTGSPYLWGGTSPKGFDCSGLVQRLFGHFGIRLPRDTDLQRAACGPLPTGSPRRPGDLLFFGREKVEHVGISLGGADFLHASGWVRVESLRSASPAYRKDLREIYLGAGRIAGLRGGKRGRH